MHPPGIDIAGLTLRYEGTPLFTGLDLQVDPGEFVVLLGPSGVGKTSLLRAVAGLLEPAEGRIAASDAAPLAGRVAYMAQQDLLLPWLNALSNVTIGDRLRDTRPDRQKAHHLLERVGLAGQAASLPNTLSGGMRQRVAIARTLYEDRPVVLMDEPFSALDSITRQRLQTLAGTLLAGRTVLMITHDPLEACRLAGRLLVLSGAPARLGAPIVPAKPPPRAVDDPDLLRLQARLLLALAA